MPKNLQGTDRAIIEIVSLPDNDQPPLTCEKLCVRVKLFSPALYSHANKGDVSRAVARMNFFIL